VELRLFIGAYNTGTAILEVLHGLRELKAVMDSRKDRLEVLLIDDGSTDTTTAALQGFAGNRDWVQMVRKSANQGNAQTILNGYTWALASATRDSYVACLDADGEHDPLEIAIRLRRHVGPDSTQSVVGSINFPDHMASRMDAAGMRMLGELQAQAAGTSEPFYIHSPGFQIHHAQTVAAIITNVVPRYISFYQMRYGTLPPWGMHGVILQLLGANGVSIRPVYLACYGRSPQRTPAKLVRQMKAGLDHLATLEEFLQLPGSKI